MSNADNISGVLFFGFGFCATHLAPLLTPSLATDRKPLMATCRDEDKAAMLKAQGITPIMLDGAALSADSLAGVSHIVLSAAPDEHGDPALPILKDALAACAKQVKWLGYLSTTGVYGDHDGAWIDEETPPGPVGARGQRRIDAEAAWGALATELGIGLDCFRLAGIYGPGRNQLASLKNGTARRIEKAGQVFSRIHVADIAQILYAAMTKTEARANAVRAYSLCDDEPAPPQQVVEYAAELLAIEPPPLLAFEQAELSPMAKSFYGENKRIKNLRVKQELGIALKYPSYREGLKALFDAGEF